MAGEWIKMRTNLWNDPRVSRLCDMTDQPEAMVVGGLYWLWAMADEHSEDGFLSELTVRAIDRKTGVTGLGQALIDIGWMIKAEGGLRVVNFDEHNGASAKRRSMDAKRKSCVRKVSASDADKKRTPTGARVRTRTKEDLNPPHTPHATPDDLPAGVIAMHLEWQPDPKTLAAYAKRAGLDITLFTPDAIGPFVVHHSAKATVKPETEFVSALINWIKRDQVQGARVVPLRARQANGANFDDTATGWLGE
ncbi:hypothetical protein HG264_04225 [Pseudomonas sp. gcc21]|uniref:DnaT-like ssDNA-binding domain-containing protein n=1 Tax=Pseudomonas sp. gcc21 TaxID=2726989 RepID=UPI0014517A1B|nr:DnaT-like ssDNA-binding domain-containing protein [Pseudomonas sp. gcc21]QJD58178.1 hypothetical protein HG264_04225 [Pseudomonas sp. gcc21]